MAKSHKLAGLIVILGLLVWFYHAFAPHSVIYFVDSNLYLAGAKSLAENGSYRLVTQVGSPHPGLYPPWQSFYLSWFWRLSPQFPENVALLNEAMILLVLVLTTSFYFFLLHRRVPVFLAVLVTCCLGMSTTLYDLAFSFVSDLWFSIFAVALAWMWLAKVDLPPRWQWAATGVLSGLMFLARTAALPVVAGVLGLTAAKGWKDRDWKPFIFASLPMTALVALWVLAPKETTSYVGFFGQSLGNGWDAAVHYLFSCLRRVWNYSVVELWNCFGPHCAEFFSSAFPRSALWSEIVAGAMDIIGVGFLTVCFVGWRREKGSVNRAIGFILLLYFLQLIFWPYGLGPRAILPVLPLLVFWFCLGLSSVSVRWRERAVLLLAALLVLNGGLNLYRTGYERDRLSDPNRLAELRELAQWVKSSLPRDARLGAQPDFPIMLFVAFSDHRISVTGETLRSMMGETDFLLVRGFRPAADRARVQASPLQVVHATQNGSFQVVRVVSP
jgi:hypothetical protein